MEDVLAAYSSFQLELLPKDWIDNIWKTHLSEDREIPEEYNVQVEQKNYYSLMQELTISLQNWLNIPEESTSTATSNSQNSEKNWVTLSSNVDHRALICFLSTFVETKPSEVRDVENKKLSCVAIRLYINLLTIPGSYSKNIFNPILFEQMLATVDSLGVLIKSAYNGDKHIKGKPKEKSYETQTDEGSSDNIDPSGTFTDSDIKEMLLEVCLILRDLARWLTTYYLNEEPIILPIMIKTLVELTLLEQERNVLSNYNLQENTTGFIAFYSYHILEQLCITQHGDVSDTVTTIMRCLLRHLVVDNVNSKISVKEYIAVKEHTYTFIHKLLRTVGIENAQGIKASVQQMCVLMPGKADLRVKVASDIVNLLRGFSPDVFEELVLWIVSLAHTSTVEYRLNGCELISRLLNVADNAEEAEINDTFESDKCGKSKELLDTEKGLVQKLLLATIIGKCRDRSTLIRYKCLAVFANIIISNQPHLKQLVAEMFIVLDSLQNEKTFDLVSFLNQDVERLELPSDPLPSGAYVIKFIERLAFDKKVFVRKNALQVLLNVCILDGKWITARRLKLFVYHCRDRSVLIRKNLSKCLTDLVIKYPNNIEVVKSWVEGVIPLISDYETKSQEKVIEYIGKVIIENILPYDETVTSSSKLPWLVLSEISKKNMRGTFRFACRSWSLQGTIKKTLFQILLSHIGTEHNLAVWFLIVNLTEFQDFPFSNEICNYFLKNVYSASTSDEYLHQLVSESLFLNWRNLGRNVKSELFKKLKFSVENFSVPISLISRRMDICFQYNKVATIEWCKKLIQSCEEYMRSSISPNSTIVFCDEDLCRYIYTLGDAAHYSPGVSQNIMDLLAKLIDPDNQDAYFKMKPAFIRGKVSAVSIVTLGKLCLQDLFLARKYVPDIAKLLNKSSSMWETIKINTMVALSDLCIRFTSVVEDHFGEMFVTLKDSNIEIRKNSLTLITQLMQEDYLKMNSPLFFYMLMMILDSSAEIRQMTESFIVNSIVKKIPGVMSQFYLEAIFFFNNYEGMHGCSKDGMTEREKIVFSLAGARRFEDRAKIYQFMLRNMKDDHRFKLSYQLCTEIFAQYLDGGKLTFDVKGNAVLKDAIYSLGCKEMRLEHMQKGAGVDEERDLECQQQDIVYGIARKAFLNQLVKKNYIENLMPVIVQLKRKLSEVKSALTRDLMLCLRELMMNYRNETDEILAMDSELAAEVALDLKRANAEEEDLSESEEYVNCNVDLKEIESQVRLMSEVVLDQRVRLSSRHSNLFQGQNDLEPSVPSTSSSAASCLIDLSTSLLRDNENSQALPFSELNKSLASSINESVCPETKSTDALSSSQESEIKKIPQSKHKEKTKSSSKSKSKKKR